MDLHLKDSQDRSTETGIQLSFSEYTAGNYHTSSSSSNTIFVFNFIPFLINVLAVATFDLGFFFCFPNSEISVST